MKTEQELVSGQPENELEREFVPIDGMWRFEGSRATYVGPVNLAGEHGYCLTRRTCRSSRISVDATIHDPAAAARVLFGYDPSTGDYYTVGINGWGIAYVLAKHTPTGAMPLRSAGGLSSLLTPGEKLIEVTVSGQSVSLAVDAVPVLKHVVQSPIPEGPVGLYAWGRGQDMVTFDKLIIRPRPRRAFVVMKFRTPYFHLYEEVIEPIAKGANYEPRRGDQIYGPGVVLSDITRDIIESDVVIVDISPTEENENVFYELGYAHALKKPTILLANKERGKLPFDISGFRVVFYTDSIRGKGDMEVELRNHLRAIGQASDE